MQSADNEELVDRDEIEVNNEQDEIDVVDEDDLDAVDDGDDAWQSHTQQNQTMQDDPSEREDLARFREEWKAEVMRNRRGAPGTPRTGQPSRLAPEIVPEKASVVTKPPSSVHSSILAASPAVAEPSPSIPSLGRDPATLPLPPKLSKALEIYEQAMLHEQRSELDDALRLYRQAFRLDENVGKVYERLESHARARTEGQHRLREGVHATPFAHAKRRSDAAISDLTRDLTKFDLSVDKSLSAYGIATGTLAHLVVSWPSNVGFEPEEETEPVHLRILPEEVLVHILQYLDVTALERFAAINRKARVLTLDPTIWRERVEKIYKPPQIADDEGIGSLLMQHMQDYRRLFVEHPRVRLDGVYIAVCHYIRDGLSESAWISVSHLITYHRYLRFLPDGDVLSLLTNEEVPPHTVIPILKPRLKMKGFFIGQWRLDGTTVYITNLMDPSGTTLRYSFQMILDLRSRPLGRWNRLDFRAYDSVSLENGEATPLALKNDRPFWFSKVRSYA